MSCLFGSIFHDLIHGMATGATHAMFDHRVLMDLQCTIQENKFENSFSFLAWSALHDPFVICPL